MSFDEDSEMPSSQESIEDEESSLSRPSYSEEEEEGKENNSRKHYNNNTCSPIIKKGMNEQSTQLEGLV